MDKIFLFFYIFSCIWGFSTEFSIDKVENLPYICYNNLVPEILLNKKNISNQCELVSFQPNDVDLIKAFTKFSPIKFVDHLWSKYFNPKLSPKIPIFQIKITPDNFSSSNFGQIQVWHPKVQQGSNENVPACICFNFVHENHNLRNNLELKFFQKNHSNTGWDIEKFKEAMQFKAQEHICNVMFVTSDGEATIISIITVVVFSIVAVLYYLFMVADKEVKEELICRTIF